jgi:hypothetical protein
MAETPILQPGDIVHLVWPSTGNKEEDERLAYQAMAVYQTQGIFVSMISHIAAPELAGPYVVSVIRKPTLIPKEN